MFAVQTPDTVYLIIQESQSCQRRKLFNENTICVMGYYKCANSTENELFKGTYQEALSNCSALEDFNNLDEESIEFMRRYYDQKVLDFEPNGLGHWTGLVRFWTEIKRMVL